MIRRQLDPPGKMAARARLHSVGLGALLLLCGCAGRPSAENPSILLITLDTTRWDHMGAYGDPQARTAEFDAIARAGVLFRYAFVDAPTTLPSHTTMLTGMLSLRHGVRLNGAFALPREVRTLPEILAEAGYATGAVLSSVTLQARYGLSQGFAIYDDKMPAEFPTYDVALWRQASRFQGVQRRAGQTTRAALRVLGRLDPPLFLWVHYVDAHQPYDPPPPWDRIPGLTRYGGEVAFVDREMGKLLNVVRDRLGETIVAVIADHGEGLGSHRQKGHGLFLYETTQRIPFVLRAPGLSPRIVEGLVRNSDLPATLLSLTHLGEIRFPDGLNALGLEAPSGRPAYCETLTPVAHEGGAATKAIRTGAFKYILSPRPELYDLRSDPEERHNLHGTLPVLEQDLRAALKAVVDRLGAEEIPRAERLGADPETRRALQALGYVGAMGASEPADELSPQGLDPKDIVDIMHSLRYVIDGRIVEARERMERFWSEHPAAPPDSTWHILYSRAYFCQAFLDRARGLHTRSLQDLQASLRLDPSFQDARELLETEGGL